MNEDSNDLAKFSKFFWSITTYLESAQISPITYLKPIIQAKLYTKFHSTFLYKKKFRPPRCNFI